MGQNEFTVFTFPTTNQTVRVVEIDGEPYWVAKDVCDVLGIDNTSQALSRLDDDEKNTIILNDGNRGNPNMAVVSESGLYALIFTSRKPEAKVFKKWVTSEVLPSIRKTGVYAESLSPSEVILRMAQRAVDIERAQAKQAKVQAEHDARLKALEDNQGGSQYVSIIGYCNLYHIVADAQRASKWGRRASMLCRANGTHIGTINSEIWGVVNTYPVAMLETHHDHIFRELSDNV